MIPVSQGKPCAGNPHARFEEGASASEEPRRSALLHRKLLLGVVLIAFGCIAWFCVVKNGNRQRSIDSTCSIPSVICGVRIPERAGSNAESGGKWLEEPVHSIVTGSVFRTMRCTYNVGDGRVNGVQLRRVFDRGESVEEQKVAYAEVMRGIDLIAAGRTVLMDDSRSSDWGVSRDISCCDNLRIYAYLHKDKNEEFPIMGVAVCVPYERERGR